MTKYIYRNTCDAESNFVINHISGYDATFKDGTVKNAVLFYMTVSSRMLIPPTLGRLCVEPGGLQFDCSFLRNIEVKKNENLEPGEIYDQVLAIDKESRLYHNHPLSNVVFMEWAKPLMNLQQYDESHRHDNFTRRLGDVPKRIMVSRCSKNDKKMADDDVKFKLAVSILVLMKSVGIHAFSAKFPLLIYANHWNIGTKTKARFLMNTWFERHQ
jgi:23S rRNA (adenine2503-C2)-methyltransferase